MVKTPNCEGTDGLNKLIQESQCFTEAGIRRSSILVNNPTVSFLVGHPRPDYSIARGTDHPTVHLT